LDGARLAAAADSSQTSLKFGPEYQNLAPSGSLTSSELIPAKKTAKKDGIIDIQIQIKLIDCDNKPLGNCWNYNRFIL
jgi:hypothetical protein